MIEVIGTKWLQRAANVVLVGGCVILVIAAYDRATLDMIEVIGAVAKWIQLVANMVLVGVCAFVVITAYDRATFDNQWFERLVRALPWLTVVAAVLLIVVLAITAAEVTGVTANVWRPASWWGLLEQTWLGKIWATRMGLTLVLLPATIYLGMGQNFRWRYLLCACIAAAALAAAAFSSHAAAEEEPWLAIAPYALHIVLAAVWFGGLLALLSVLYGSFRRGRGETGVRPSAIAAIMRFSVMALPVMIGIVVTGLIVADTQIDSRYAALVSTDYGWFLLTKLGLLCAILVIAAYARFVWVPSVEKGSPAGLAEWRPLQTGVSIEFGLATLLILAATLCASSIPAKHAVIDEWPYSFRFSLGATLELPETIPNLITAGVLTVGAMVVGLIWLRARIRWPRVILGTSLVLAFGGIGMTLYAIATEASVDTYRDSAVPFDAISIARGAHLFAENCSPCHGPQAKGDGPLANSLPVKPADLLTEPHTARHLAGDLYHWIMVGIPESGMPGFGHRLSEDDQWDIVNFLHVVSRGYESRILRTRVVPDGPSENLGAPDFSFTDQHGVSHTLKDYREKKSVLLVFFRWPDANNRLKALQTAYPALKANEAEVIAVPWDGVRPNPSWAEEMPFLVVQDGGEIGKTYAAFRRSLSQPDLFGSGTVPDHMELLVDRFGYLRGRWLPAQDSTGWDDDQHLVDQLDQLRREEEILPPAGDHVH